MPRVMAKNYEFDMAKRGRERRLELGLSMQDIATRMRCTYKRVSLLENDGCVTLRVIREWARALEMDPRVLAFGPTLVLMPPVKCGDA